MANNKNIVCDSFVFYRSFIEGMEGLNDEEVGKLLKVLCQYALNNNDFSDKLKGFSRNIFTMIKPLVDANNKKRQVGQKGGRPKGLVVKKEITTGYENEKPEVIKKNNQRLLKNKPNEDVNGNGNGNEHDNFNISILDYYNKVTKLKCTLNDDIIHNLKIIQDDGHSLDDCKIVIDFITNDKHHIDGGWTGLINIFRPTKFVEKLERAKLLKAKNQSNNQYITESTHLDFA